MEQELVHSMVLALHSKELEQVPVLVHSMVLEPELVLGSKGLEPAQVHSMVPEPEPELVPVLGSKVLEPVQVHSMVPVLVQVLGSKGLEQASGSTSA